MIAEGICPTIDPKILALLQHKEILTGPFLLAKPDFSKTEVVKAYVYTIVAPAIDFWKETTEGKKGAQLARMKAVRIFNPLHVLVNKVSVSDIDGGRGGMDEGVGRLLVL